MMETIQKPSILDAVLASAFNYEQPHYEDVDQAISELADLRKQVSDLEAENKRLSEFETAYRELLRSLARDII